LGSGEGEEKMLSSIATLLAIILLTIVLAKRARDRRELEQHSISPEDLHALMASEKKVLVFDVRQPLDLLGASVIIPGARWLAPDEVRANPSLLPAETDLVVYCTCPSDKTSQLVLHRALARGFLRIKFLKGGLDGWRAKGFPVEPYTKPFHLSSARSNHLTVAS
jgi:rhodanese-related sulfurtransferase